MHETFELFINKLVFSMSVAAKNKVDDADSHVRSSERAYRAKYTLHKN